MTKLIYLLLVMSSSVAFAKIEDKKVSPLVSLKLDSDHWSVVETKKFLNSKVTMIFNKQNDELFGPVISTVSTTGSTDKKLEELRNVECVSKSFEHKFIKVKEDERFICDISFIQNKKNHRQVWIFDRIKGTKGSFFQKTIISFGVDDKLKSALNSEVDSLVSNISGAVK